MLMFIFNSHIPIIIHNSSKESRSLFDSVI
nr:MAG TPA: hypothetical protein [Crassvirales sp.]